jgi:hypothetical protein
MPHQFVASQWARMSDGSCGSLTVTKQAKLRVLIAPVGPEKVDLIAAPQSSVGSVPITAASNCNKEGSQKATYLLRIAGWCARAAISPPGYSTKSAWVRSQSDAELAFTTGGCLAASMNDEMTLGTTIPLPAPPAGWFDYGYAVLWNGNLRCFEQTVISMQNSGVGANERNVVIVHSRRTFAMRVYASLNLMEPRKSGDPRCRLATGRKSIT